MLWLFAFDSLKQLLLKIGGHAALKNGLIMWNFLELVVEKNTALLFIHITQDRGAAYEVLNIFVCGVTKIFIGSRNIIQYIIININGLLTIGQHQNRVIANHHLVEK